MANKKKTQQNNLISPERYMREMVRSLPIGKCYVTPDWETNGLAHVIVTRVRPRGNFALAIFLVDTFCLGVKDAQFVVNTTEDMLNEMIALVSENIGIKEADYAEVHNLIYGAIAFAEEGGINPVREFNIAKYILEEDVRHELSKCEKLDPLWYYNEPDIHKQYERVVNWPN